MLHSATEDEVNGHWINFELTDHSYGVRPARTTPPSTDRDRRHSTITRIVVDESHTHTPTARPPTEQPPARPGPAAPFARWPTRCSEHRDITGGTTLAQGRARVGRIGCVGFGGPPAHIALLRELCVEAALAERATSSSTRSPPATSFPARRRRSLRSSAPGTCGPHRRSAGGARSSAGLVAILALAALFLRLAAGWVRGAGAGAGAAVAAVAVHAAAGPVPRAGDARRPAPRWAAYAAAARFRGRAGGPSLVLVLLACGAVEVAALAREAGWSSVPGCRLLAAGGRRRRRAALAWVAFKVGALSYGGGFVIIPLMQADAVDRYGWMTDGRVPQRGRARPGHPGPVTHTVAVVGFAADGVAGGASRGRRRVRALLRVRPRWAPTVRPPAQTDRVRAFLDGAGPAAIGAILGVGIPLAAASSGGSTRPRGRRRSRCSCSAAESSRRCFEAGLPRRGLV